MRQLLSPEKACQIDRLRRNDQLPPFGANCEHRYLSTPVQMSSLTAATRCVPSEEEAIDYHVRVPAAFWSVHVGWLCGGDCAGAAVAGADTAEVGFAFADPVDEPAFVMPDMSILGKS